MLGTRKLNSNAYIIVCPQTCAGRTNSRIPLIKACHGDLVVVLDRGASRCGLDKVKLLAATDHTGLDSGGR